MTTCVFKKFVTVMVVAFLFAALVWIGCGDGGNPVGSMPTYGSFTDPRDGKKYRIVEIGSLTWMVDNLNYQTDSSWCYNDSPDYCAKYGRLYTWVSALGLEEIFYTAWWNGNSGTQGVCPAGWRVPGDSDWDDLITAIGDSSIAGTKLKSKKGWYSNGGGTNELGFSATPGGFRHTSGEFFNAGKNGLWWSSSNNISYAGRFRGISYNREYVGDDLENKSYGFSVRCVSDILD